MVFGHLVKHNGVYYPAGTDVPIEETSKGGGVETPTVIVSGKVETRKYSEEDLDVPYYKLKALAKKEGFTVDNKAKAVELKEMLRTL